MRGPDPLCGVQTQPAVRLSATWRGSCRTQPCPYLRSHTFLFRQGFHHLPEAALETHVASIASRTRQAGLRGRWWPLWHNELTDVVTRIVTGTGSRGSRLRSTEYPPTRQLPVLTELVAYAVIPVTSS